MVEPHVIRVLHREECGIACLGKWEVFACRFVSCGALRDGLHLSHRKRRMAAVLIDGCESRKNLWLLEAKASKAATFSKQRGVSSAVRNVLRKRFRAWSGLPDTEHDVGQKRNRAEVR